MLEKAQRFNRLERAKTRELLICNQYVPRSIRGAGTKNTGVQEGPLFCAATLADRHFR